MPHCHTVLLEGIEHSCEGVEVCAVGGEGQELEGGREGGRNERRVTDIELVRLSAA